MDISRLWGLSVAPTYSLRLNEEDDWMQQKCIFKLHGSAAPKKLEKAIGRDFWLKKEASKHRYIYFLGNKKENRYFKNDETSCYGLS